MSNCKPTPLTVSSSMLDHCRWHLLADIGVLQQEALRRILAIAALAIKERGRFLLVLAGGETPRGLYQQLRQAKANWSAWHIYFSDERCLPVNDPARNSRMAGEAWLDHAPIPARQIHLIAAELGAIQAAEAYANTLRNVGEFDLVLLGLGEDGHTASLFPGQAWAVAPITTDTVAVLNAPKPPAQRVSLTASRLSRTRQLLFLIKLAGKQAAVTNWRAGKDLPARHMMPANGVDILLAITEK